LNYIKEFTDVVINPVEVALGIKRRVIIAKVNGLVADESPQNIEIIAVIEFVH